jgi:hypothetical protein
MIVSLASHTVCKCLSSYLSACRITSEIPPVHRQQTCHLTTMERITHSALRCIGKDEKRRRHKLQSCTAADRDILSAGSVAHWSAPIKWRLLAIDILIGHCFADKVSISKTARPLLRMQPRACRCERNKSRWNWRKRLCPAVLSHVYTNMIH